MIESKEVAGVSYYLREVSEDGWRIERKGIALQPGDTRRYTYSLPDQKVDDNTTLSFLIIPNPGISETITDELNTELARLYGEKRISGEEKVKVYEEIREKESILRAGESNMGYFVLEVGQIRIYSFPDKEEQSPLSELSKYKEWKGVLKTTEEGKLGLTIFTPEGKQIYEEKDIGINVPRSKSIALEMKYCEDGGKVNLTITNIGGDPVALIEESYQKVKTQ